MPKKAKDPAEPVRYWLAEIAAARKRDSDYRKEGKRVRAIYAGEKKEQTPFNIVFSNTETMLPAMYSAIPRPIVQRRYKDEDPLGKASADAGQRCLEFLLDTNIDGYETFNESMKAVTLDALLPGRGLSTAKYDAEIGEYSEPRKEGDENESEDEAEEQEVIPVKKSELVCTEARSWDRCLFGYARKWSKVPWIAYEEFMDKTEAARLFGKEVAAKIQYTKGEADEEGESKKKNDEEDNTGERKTALVYQIWDKAGGRKIRYVSPHYKDDYLKVEDDPLNLTGFYNCPRPIMFIEKTDDLSPTSLYSLYENQAIELNNLTVRINRIISAIKARGLYDSNLGEDVGRLMEADDNQLIPADKAASISAQNGIDKSIWFMPLEVLIQTLRELYAAREQCKNVIYEIMGISDILRGSTQASETATAQQIKSQWGSLRLKPKQAEVQRYARDMLRIMLEIAATKFSEETWARMTGLPYLTQQQAQQAMMVAQAAQQQGNPQAIQQLQQQITWKQVLDLLKDDLQRAYKVDIETNSTLEPEAAEDQKAIADLMTAIGQYLNGIGPLVQQGVLPFEAASTMLLAISRRFRFGTEIEDQIKAMKAPKPQGDGGAAEKQAMDAQKQGMAKDAQIAKLQTDLAKAAADKELNAKKSELDVRALSLDTREQMLDLQAQRAKESIEKHANDKKAVLDGENLRLDHRKHLSGLEQKQSKTEQAAMKQVDSQLAQAIGDMSKLMQQLADMQQQAVQEIVKQGEMTRNAVSAPRKRTPKRGQDGRIESVIDEAVS